MALIYGELDIAVPDIDRNFLNEFVKRSFNEHVRLGHAKEEDVYFLRNKKHYPWHRRVLQYKTDQFHNFHLLDEFKELNSCLDKLPIDRDERIILMLHQEAQYDYDFNFHFDNDNPYGFRICLGLDTKKTFLEQAKIKDEFHQHALDLKKIEDHMVEETRYTIVPRKENTAFILNGNSYPHRVPINSSTGRTVFVVRGKINTIDDLKFLQKQQD
jgi:hypothetical protein